jgi:hypothetical protein
LLLVAAYAALVIALPGAEASDVTGITLGHLSRNAMLLCAIGAIAVTVFCASAAVQPERRRVLTGRIRDFAAGSRDWRCWTPIFLPQLYLALLLATFSTYKQAVLPAAGFGLDFALADLDRALFFGVDAWRATHWLVPSAAGTALIDTAYMLWFIPMLLIVLLSGMAPRRLQTRYLLAFALTWIVAGTVLAYLLPGAGPCYFEAFHADARFAPLIERLTAQNDALVAGGGSGFGALLGQDMLLRAHQEQDLIFAGGISAMPSMHVALATLFARAGFACHRVAGWVLSAFALLIWFGSVHLGWHYAIDGLVGGAVALLMWKLAGLWTEQLWRAAPAQSLPAGLVPESQPL